MSVEWPRSRTYVILTSLNWLLFLAAVSLLSWGDVPAVAVLPVILFVTLTVIGQFLAAYRLVAAQDEFVRALNFKCGIAAAGVTISTAVLWGLAEQFLAAPEVPMWLVYPFFWGAFGMVSPFIRSSRA